MFLCFHVDGMELRLHKASKKLLWALSSLYITPLHNLTLMPLNYLQKATYRWSAFNRDCVFQWHLAQRFGLKCSFGGQSRFWGLLNPLCLSCTSISCFRKPRPLQRKAFGKYWVVSRGQWRASVIHLALLLDVSHHGGLCLQERLGSGVSLELGHVFCAVPGYGGTVQTVVAADVAL